VTEQKGRRTLLRNPNQGTLTAETTQLASGPAVPAGR